MPCYAFDSDYKKHDMNPLIKMSGGYLVDDSDPDTSLVINVCRDIGQWELGEVLGPVPLTSLVCICVPVAPTGPIQMAGF